MTTPSSENLQTEGQNEEPAVEIPKASLAAVRKRVMRKVLLTTKVALMLRPEEPIYRKGSYQSPTAETNDLLANFSDVEAVKTALEAGAKPLFVKDGTTALHMACGANAVQAATLMLEAYAKEDHGGPFGLRHAMSARTDVSQATPIVVASGEGADDVIEMLLSKGANANDANSYG